MIRLSVLCCVSDMLVQGEEEWQAIGGHAGVATLGGTNRH
jgi:hypothetical protein